MNKIDLKDILQENLADDNQDYLSILGDEKEMLNDFFVKYDAFVTFVCKYKTHNENNFV